MLSFLVKVGGAILATGTTISIPLVIIYGKENSNFETKRFKEGQKCFEIGIEKNIEESKLVICADSKYYLYDQDKKFKEIKSIKRTDTDRQITVTLGEIKNSKTLTLSDSQWNSLSSGLNLQRSCNLTGIDGEQPFLSCSLSSRRKWEAVIKLTSLNYLSDISS